MALSRSCRAALAPVFRAKQFHTGSVLAARQSAGSPVAAAPKARRVVPNLEPLEYDDDALADQVREGDDAPEPTHRYLQQQREMLYYLRLIEHEMPKLVGPCNPSSRPVLCLTRPNSAYRRPFVPPNSSNPLVIRSISYGGEPHPAAAKSTIVVPVARLPLKNEQAVHKFKVLAGVRWSPEPPTDSGLTPEEGGAEHGYFKIACEDFPKAPMNLKWASDTLDRLLAAANVRSHGTHGVIRVLRAFPARTCRT